MRAASEPRRAEDASARRPSLFVLHSFLSFFFLYSVFFHYLFMFKQLLDTVISFQMLYLPQDASARRPPCGPLLGPHAPAGGGPPRRISYVMRYVYIFITTSFLNVIIIYYFQYHGGLRQRHLSFYYYLFFRYALVFFCISYHC